jgi:O-antigen/teichoic acid export membrane protein
MASLLIYPAFIGIAAIAPILVPVVFGAKWLSAIPVLQIMTVGGLAKIYIDMYDATLRGLGKPQWVIMSRAAQALLTVILALAAVRYGVVAVAAILAIKGILFMPLNVWILQRAGGPRLGPVLAANLPTLAAAALMGACVFAWIHVMRNEFDEDWVLLGTAVAIGVASYAVFAFILVRSTVYEVVSLLGSLRRAQVQATVK